MRTIRILVLLSLTLNLFAQNASLYICYPLDGNATDFSGNGNHGNLNGAIPVVDRFGNSGKALSFDGLNDYISITSTLPDMARFSISVWVYHTDPMYPSGILSDADPTTFKDLFFNVSNDGVGATANKNGGTLNQIDLHPLGNFTPAVTGQWLNNAWHHIVWVCDSSTQTIYIDTIVHFTATVSGTNLGFHNGNASLGRLGDGVTNGGYFQYFEGDMDDFMLYDGALDFLNVKALFMNAGPCQAIGQMVHEHANRKISIAPNPSSDHIAIQLPSSLGDMKIRIIDEIGRVILNRTIKSGEVLDVSALQKGIYFIHFSDSGIPAQKFIRD